MKFVSRGTVVGQFGPTCPRGKNLESHGSDFLVLKSLVPGNLEDLKSLVIGNLEEKIF
jgi:hypothetical protein